MASDVILAECAGQAWLVRGEQHIDHLLANTLDTHISIKVIACESKSEVNALWRQYDGGHNDGGGGDESMMWLIHPAIVNRVRAQPGEFVVKFAEWSASLDEAALTTLQAISRAASQRSEAIMVLVRYVAADNPGMAADLANLRSGLLEARLASLGVEVARIVRETQDAAQAGHADRIDLVFRTVG
jgi:hypothetical protein